MDTSRPSEITFAEHQRKRTTSSVLKSIIAPRGHQRNQSTGPRYVNSETEKLTSDALTALNVIPMLRPGHAVAAQHLKEESMNKENLRSPATPIEVYEDKARGSGLHKKTKSSVSLKSLMGNEKGNASKSRSPKKQDLTKPKKSKSSTTLSALLSRPKSSKDLKLDVTRQQNDKENQTPPQTAELAPPPIWAQFATQAFQESANSRKIPLNDLNNVDDEIAKYTPGDYSPSKQRNFQYHEEPSLIPKNNSKPRPKSAFVVSDLSTTSFTEILSSFRKSDDGKRSSEVPNQNQQFRSGVNSDELSCDARQSRWSGHDKARKVSDDSSKAALTLAKRGSRVMAAVAAFNGKAKIQVQAPAKEIPATPVDFKDIEDAFESLLDSRNVPQQTRDKMRALDTSIKADFIKKDKSYPGSAPTVDAFPLSTSAGTFPQRPFPGRRSKTDDGVITHSETSCEAGDVHDSPRKSRGRSRTSTLSKGDTSPSKKQKHERPLSRGRPNSGNLTQSGASKSLTSAGAAQALSFLTKVPKPAVPEEFIFYLRKVQEPEVVDVDRLHKLCQLLRNETIAWVDTFIIRGGMNEIVQLLYRIIKIEWRTAHEDNLLHETLLCLKALCTATLARQQLADIQATLFPTLLAMLFGEEKKGPSEFATRSIIISLLFTYLSDSSATDSDSRVKTVLSHLRDPSPPEAAQPPTFIASMHRPRPYRVWCNEIVSVTKEVFWVFLHHTNTIPYPSASDSPSCSYKNTHFPRERPPIPASPYVGGVEFEATNYLALHLDLLNGIIASLATSDERNSLRQELKASGFEKCLGGSLRTCKEKFYGAIHDCLSTWIGAAREDGWDPDFVREGPRGEEVVRMSPAKKQEEAAPRLEIPIPSLDLGGVGGGGGNDLNDGGWL